MTDSSTTSVPPSILRVVSGALGIALRVAIVLSPTVFGSLHRFGAFEMLFIVCLLAGVWVISSLVGLPLTYPRSLSNLFAWGLLTVVLLQLLPLPLVNRYELESLPGPAAAVLTDQAPELPHTHRVILPVGRYSLRPGATLGLLILLCAAAAMYWLTASASSGRKALRWTTWSAVLGPSLLAFWVIVWDLASPDHVPEGVSRPAGPLLILGGDSYVPALLAGLPLALAATLRLAGWTPRRPPGRRQSRFGWLDRAATVWASIGVVATGVMAFALGVSSVPRSWLAVCAGLAIVFVLGGCVAAGPGAGKGRSPLRIAALLAFVVVAAMAAGSMVGRASQPAARGDDSVMSVIDAAAPHRAIFGVGGGAISPRATFGKAGWSEAPDDNVDTDGFLVIRAEFGWLGLAVVALGAAALAAGMLRTWMRSRAAWTRMAVMAGLGALVANLVYFRHDASALLAPNLLVLAGVLGAAAAWAANAVRWRPAIAGRVGRAHWPMVAGAVGLMAALGTAETNMVTSAAGGTGVDFKFLHFGGFAFVCLLLCRALGPHPTVRRLAVQVLLAVAWASAMGVLVEFGQRHLTRGRSFEVTDMMINFCGTILVGVAWWAMRRTQVQPRHEELPAD